MKPYIQETLSDDKGSVVSAQRIPPKSEGGGGEVTTAAVVSALMDMSNVQRNSVMQKLGAATSASVQLLDQTVKEIDEDLKTVYVRTIDVDGATPTIEPAPNTIYNCGTLDSLTITDPPAQGIYSIVFTSGATATTTTIPSTILGLEDFAAEANTLYEINVLDGRAVVGSWAVSST